MARWNKAVVIAAAALVVLTPTAVFADIVFDPTNFAEAVLQVADDVQLVDQFTQEVQNDLAMVKGWNFSQLPALLENMDLWQQVLSAYSSTDPGAALDSQYPADPGSYAGTTDAAIAAQRSAWDQEQRSVLIENRTVQDQTYLNLQPTAERVQADVEHSNSASGATAATQAGNEELGTLIAQVETLQAQELTEGRGEVERDARDQAEQAYADQQQQAVRGDWESPQQPATTLSDPFPSANP